MNDQIAQRNFAGSPLVRPHPDLSIVVPTFREAGNINPLIDAVRDALAFDNWEIIFVDDNSDDATWSVARDRSKTDGRVRCIRRIGRRGLAGATIEGFLSASADIVAVMDCDLQHDETLLTSMLAEVRAGADIVIATRYSAGGGASGGFAAGWRRAASRHANRLANAVLRAEVSDPMSGFFMMRRAVFEAVAPKLSSSGFKILLDILATSTQGLRIAEVPYAFRPRNCGESKLGELVILEFVTLLAAKVTRDWVSPRFLLFALVGASGVAVHLAALKAALATAALPFATAQVMASYVAMTSNFLLNNRLTYSDRRLTGVAALKGLLSFYLVCSIGTIANIGVAQMLYGGIGNWWQAGLAGALMAAVFNYAASAIFTWRN